MHSAHVEACVRLHEQNAFCQTHRIGSTARVLSELFRMQITQVSHVMRTCSTHNLHTFHMKYDIHVHVHVHVP